MSSASDGKSSPDGTEYTRNYCNKLKRKERLEKSKQCKAGRSVVAAQKAVTEKLRFALSQLNDIGGTTSRMESMSVPLSQQDDPIFLTEDVNLPFHPTILNFDEHNSPLHCAILDVDNVDSSVRHAVLDADTINVPSDLTNLTVETVEQVVAVDILHEERLSNTFVSSLEMDTSEQYFPTVYPTTTPQQSAREDAITKLNTIFTVHKATTRLQDAILQFLRQVPKDVVNTLPLNHTTLRPSRIHYERYPLDPGEMIYFGIANVLTVPGVELFDRTANRIQLSISIDGLPLSRNVNGVGFWPLLAAADQYPVFLVGLYCGKSKPECPNAFMRPLVKELKKLENEGLCVPMNNSSTEIENCGVHVYSVRLHNLIMDLPALSYITCIIGHAGANACPKCTNPGTHVALSGCGLNKKGRIKKGIRYVHVYDAGERRHDDFRVYWKHCMLSKLNTGLVTTDCCSHYSAVREHYEGYGCDRDDLFENMFENDNHDDDFLGPEDYDLANDDEHITFLRQHHHQQHRTKRNLENADHVTILFLLKHFDIIDHVPVEYMHAVCIGVMQSLLLRWTDHTKFKLNSRNKVLVSRRLLRARRYFPVEFQRKPEKLQYISSWKATQYRSFLLYIGVVALHGVLDVEKLNHFYAFVTAMRTLVCRVDNVGDRDRIMKGRAKKADVLLRFFVKEAIRIYGPEIATLKLHLLLHIVDDYLRFGPLDLWSAFRFESILGKLKRLIYAHRNPGTQIINAYSNLLQTGNFGKAGSQGIDSLDEYFEQPTLKYLYCDSCDQCVSGQSCGLLKQCYKRLYVKTFVIRTDNLADSCCVVKGNIFLRVQKIVKNTDSGRIYLLGNMFDQLESLYRINVPNSKSGTTEYVSDDVGVLKGRLADQEYQCGFEEIVQKVCAIPLDNYNGCHSHTSETYALLRLLH